ncbi:hypothetical protein LJC56_06555, partial [Christensenellaceae bacterium OttesenSCG-928-K19]|nr:hypothetical protein [Christensenellaceae bacterium OttesenSCG-928-K19]
DQGGLEGKLQKLKDGILHRNMVLYPAIDAVRAISLRGDRLILHVAHEDEMMAHMLAEEASQDDVQPVIEEVFGKRLSIGFAQAEEKEEEKGQAAPADDVTKELIDLFGEENVEIK